MALKPEVFLDGLESAKGGIEDMEGYRSNFHQTLGLEYWLDLHQGGLMDIGALSKGARLKFESALKEYGKTD